MKLLALLIGAVAISALAGCGYNGPAPLLTAHAHNDYEHDRPLLDALEQGFCSVEADIFLSDGKLLVAHNRVDLKPDRSLEALYLDPLKQRIATNKGWVHRKGIELTLLIDIKSDARTTYQALHQVLANYSDMLVTVIDGIEKPGPVRVIISGNRDKETISAQKTRYAGIDGRFSDLDSDMPVHLMPWISDNASRITKWRGQGPFPQADIDNLKEITKQAHAKGRKVRLWGTPDQQDIWQILQQSNVDIIGADDLIALAQYLQINLNQ